jgi:flagellar motility protein MotE (MotC chaperone)
MSESARLRVIPVAIAAMAALGVLKIGGLVLNGGYALSPVSLAAAQDAAQDAAPAAPAAPAGAPPAPPAGGGAAIAEPADGAVAPAPPGAGGEAGAGGPEAALSPSERAVLESLRQRREDLEEQERALMMRENLLRAAEQRIDGKLADLKAIEKRIQASISEKEDADDARFADLVSMYETMKAKAAAVIFNRLDVNVAVGVARRMNPEALADILARMDPAVAERVTVELAQISERGTGLGNELDAILPQ